MISTDWVIIHIERYSFIRIETFEILLTRNSKTKIADDMIEPNKYSITIKLIDISNPSIK